MNKKAIIIGAGPAGLTAAYELITKTNIKPIIYEMSNSIGGLSRTINYKGNRIDIGGHRFFSKSRRIMKWWTKILPLQGKPAKDDRLLNRKIPLANNGPDPEVEDKVLLIRRRFSRIYFSGKFFDYPISLNRKTLLNLGFLNAIEIAITYFQAKIFPREEKTLEDFFINRFGKKLYQIFFKDYTEKVWGIPCSEIDPSWGRQRIKGLSLTKAIYNSIMDLMNGNDIYQKNIETSLIRQFLYPKYGPGQLWEEVAKFIRNNGGKIYLNHKVTGIFYKHNKILAVEVKNETTGKTYIVDTDYLFSTMPIKEFVLSFDDIPSDVEKIAENLAYRDFIVVGLLLKKLKIKNDTKIKTINNIIPDNWIYIQDREINLSRIQIFNNWSPYLLRDYYNNVWIGLEYICHRDDKLWRMTNNEIVDFAIDEAAKLDIIREKDVIDSTVIRTLYAYPVYSRGYKNFDIIKRWLNKFENLFVIGRCGMHRYNNQDHSMLTAMVAVENIVKGIKSKDNIWAINTEKDYHEECSNRNF